MPDREDVENVLILEEAHRLLSHEAAQGTQRGKATGQNSGAKTAALFAEMLAEMRALRQGVAVVEQMPTKIIPEAVKNSNLKIMCRITAKEDRDYLGAAMNFTDEQKDFVSNLRIDKDAPVNTIQFVAFDESLDQPLLLELPLPNEQEWFFGKDEKNELQH